MKIARDTAVDAALSCVAAGRKIIEASIQLSELNVEPERRHFWLWLDPGEEIISMMTHHRAIVDAWVNNGLHKAVYLKLNTVMFGQVCESFFHATLAMTDHVSEAYEAVFHWAESFGDSPWSSDSDGHFEAVARMTLCRIGNADLGWLLELEAGLNDEYKPRPDTTKKMLHRCHVWESQPGITWGGVALIVDKVNKKGADAQEYGKRVKKWAKRHGILLRKENGGNKLS